jgi:hypothetical protein
MRTYTGMVEIDGAEFWAFVQNHIKDSNTIFKNPEFTMEDVVLTPVEAGKPVVYVPTEDFWSFVIENYMPCPSDDVDCNKPVYNEKNQCLVIEFAGGSIHPSQWAVKPHWLVK